MEPDYYSKKPLPKYMKDQIEATPESSVHTRGCFGGNNDNGGGNISSMITASTGATKR